MKNAVLSILILSLLLAPSAWAQGKLGKVDNPETTHSVKVEFSSTDQLEAEGWEEVEPDVWRKTFDDGVTSEIALGAVAYERTRTWLDAQIATLEEQESLDAEQELRLFELLLRREQLGQKEVPTKRSGSRTLCTGTATFEHNFGWLNFAYPYADSVTSYTSWIHAGTATTRAEARLCAGSCIFRTDSDTLTGWGSVVSIAPASGIPTWTCTASAFGSVVLSGVNPSCGETVATFSSFWSC